MPTVVVVDDDEGIRFLTSRMLGKAGFDVEVFDNVDGALARLREQPTPDLVLLDGVLPQRDGWDFLQDLSKDESLPSLPIVLMSDLVDLSQSKLPPRVKIRGRLEKPFTSDQLVAAIREALAQP